MKRYKLAILSGTALSGLFGIAAQDAHAITATTTVPTGGLTFAREAFPSATSVSIPATLLPVFTFSTADTVSLSSGNVITFTLSNGAQFSGAAPTATASTITLASSAGTYNSNSTAVTYTVTSANSTGTITLGAFTLTTLANNLTAGTAINLVPTTNGTAFTAPVTLQIATSAASTTFSIAANTAPVVDIANGGLGRQFRVGTTNQTFLRLATLAYTPGTIFLNPDGTSTFLVGTGDVLSASLTGDFTNISSAYLTTSACAATAPSGAITGTVSGSTATISSLTTGTYNVCVVANGTGVISTNAATILGSVTAAFAARSSFTPALVNTGGFTNQLLGTVSYNGAVSTFNFYFGTTGSYTQFLNVANSNNAAATVLVVGRPTTGATTGAQTSVAGTLDTSLGIGASRLYSATDVSNALNGNVFNGVKGTITVLVSQSGATISNIVLNPNGGINNLQ